MKPGIYVLSKFYEYLNSLGQPQGVLATTRIPNENGNVVDKNRDPNLPQADADAATQPGEDLDYKGEGYKAKESTEGFAYTSPTTGLWESKPTISLDDYSLVGVSREGLVPFTLLQRKSVHHNQLDLNFRRREVEEPANAPQPLVEDSLCIYRDLMYALFEECQGNEPDLEDFVLATDHWINLKAHRLQIADRRVFDNLKKKTSIILRNEIEPIPGVQVDAAPKFKDFVLDGIEGDEFDVPQPPERIFVPLKKAGPVFDLVCNFHLANTDISDLPNMGDILVYENLRDTINLTSFSFFNAETGEPYFDNLEVLVKDLVTMVTFFVGETGQMADSTYTLLLKDWIEFCKAEYTVSSAGKQLDYTLLKKVFDKLNDRKVSY